MDYHPDLLSSELIISFLFLVVQYISVRFLMHRCKKRSDNNNKNITNVTNVFKTLKKRDSTQLQEASPNCPNAKILET